MNDWYLFFGFILLNAVLYRIITRQIEKEFGIIEDEVSEVSEAPDSAEETNYSHGNGYNKAKQLIEKIKYFGMHFRIAK
jgi:hypothetical protein